MIKRVTKFGEVIKKYTLDDHVKKSLKYDGFVVCDTKDKYNEVTSKYPNIKVMMRKDWVNRIKEIGNGNETR